MTWSQQIGEEVGAARSAKGKEVKLSSFAHAVTRHRDLLNSINSVLTHNQEKGSRSIIEQGNPYYIIQLQRHIMRIAITMKDRD
jgi:hypothetical protein